MLIIAYCNRFACSIISDVRIAERCGWSKVDAYMEVDDAGHADSSEFEYANEVVL